MPRIWATLIALLLLAACGTAPRQGEVRAPTTAANYAAVGLASWYGRKFHGRRAASGQRYDMNGMTAAHRNLPFGTKVRVTNLENGRAVTLTINDRGPFIRGRIIDLSQHGAEHLGNLRAGTARVRVESLTAAAAAVQPRDVAYLGVLATAMAQPRLIETAWQDAANGVHGVITPLTTPAERGGAVCRNYRRTAVRAAGTRTYVGRACNNSDDGWRVARERRDS